MAATPASQWLAYYFSISECFKPFVKYFLDSGQFCSFFCCSKKIRWCKSTPPGSTPTCGWSKAWQCYQAFWLSRKSSLLWDKTGKHHHDNLGDVSNGSEHDFARSFCKKCDGAVFYLQFCMAPMKEFELDKFTAIVPTYDETSLDTMCRYVCFCSRINPKQGHHEIL